MFGWRPDGRSAKIADPIIKMTPYIMPMRCDAQVFLQHNLDYETLTRFIAAKARDGHKITFMEILIAAYVRGVAEVPEVNRFIINKRYYNRTELTAAVTILIDTNDGSIEENTIKVFFDPSDTIYDVSKRIKKQVEANRRATADNFTLKLASALVAVPGIPNLVVGLIKLLDRYGLCPKALLDAIPFHTSIFVANMASIAMHNVYHHIYNFGSVGIFFSIGTPERGYTVNARGEPVRKCTLPIGITADERVCAGATYARLFAAMKKYLNHPELLEEPPAEVQYCDGVVYHQPKPE